MAKAAPQKRKLKGGFAQESDLYPPVKAYFQAQGWDMKAEVAHCDAVAMKDGALLAVELKLTLNLDVVLQGVARQRVADLVYLAVPAKGKTMASPRWGDILSMLQRLNIGLLVVSCGRAGADVQELLTPQAGQKDRQRSTRLRKTTLREFQGRRGDPNTGGSTRMKLMTAYRQEALRLAALLEELGPSAAKALKPEGETSRRTYVILKLNHYGWFEFQGGGVFGLTEAGREGLRRYAGALALPPEDEAFGGTIED